MLRDVRQCIFRPRFVNCALADKIIRPSVSAECQKERDSEQGGAAKEPLPFRRFIAVALLVGIFSTPLAAGPLAPDTLPKADLILVFKAKRELDLMRNGQLIRAYPIALGTHPLGPKRKWKDGRTPEGTYSIDWRTKKTPYHRALHISYPNAADRKRAMKAHLNPGGDIFIHGMPTSFGRYDPVNFFVDWTNGCISVGNIAIEEIWNSVDDGTKIEIRP